MPRKPRVSVMPKSLYVVTATPSEANVASARVKVRADSAAGAEARAKRHIEHSNNHLARLSTGPRPAVRLRHVRYTAVLAEGEAATTENRTRTRSKTLPDGTVLNVTLHGTPGKGNK